MPAPSQVGHGLEISGAPTIAGGKVVKDTYRKRDATNHEEFEEGENGETCTVVFSNGGFIHSFDLALNASQTEYKKGDVIAIATVNCVIIECETQRAGGKAVIQSIEALQRAGMIISGGG